MARPSPRQVSIGGLLSLLLLAPAILAKEPAFPVLLDLQGTDGTAFTATLRQLTASAPAESRFEGQLPFKGSVPAAGPGPWSLRIDGSGLFPCELEIAEPQAALRLGEVGRLTGILELEKGRALPEKIRAGVSVAPGESPRGPLCGLPQIFVDCSREGHRFECTVPAGALDLRIEAPPYAPVYFWDFKAEASRASELGKVRLRSGASLAGWLKAFGPWPEDGPIVVAKRHLLGEPGSAADGQRLGSMSHRTVASSRGFFQFVGLAPGAWDLEVESSGFAPAKVGPIQLEPGLETQLEDALELHPPLTLSVYLEPPTDWAGNPWRLLLKRSKAFSSVAEVVADIRASLQGEGSLPNLEAGEYRIEVMDVQEGSWHEQLVEVRPAMPPLFLDMPAIRVAGELVLGGESVAGTVVFGAYDRPRIPAKTDEEGRFHAILPRAGEWKVLVEHSNVESRLPPVEIGKAGEKNLTIRLPNTSLRGKVLLDGKPLPKASVVLRRNSGLLQPLGSVITDEAGKFEFRGIEEGPFRAAAALGKETSEWVEAELRESSPLEIELQIAKTRKVPGRVTAAGMPIAGAAVIALTGELGPFPAAQQKLSGADGSFELDLPGQSQTFDLLAFAPGQGVAWQRLRVPPEGTSFEVSFPSASGKASVVVPVTSFASWYLAHGESVLPFRVVYRWMSEAGLVEQGTKDFAILLRGLEAGSYTLCQRSGVAFENCVSADLAPGGEIELNPCGPRPELCEGAGPSR